MLTNHRWQWFCLFFFWNSWRDVLCELPRGYRLTWPWNQWTLYSKSFSQGLRSETNDCYAELKSCSTDKLISGRTTQVRHFKHRSYIQLYPVTNEMNYALNADKSVQWWQERECKNSPLIFLNGSERLLNGQKKLTWRIVLIIKIFN